MLSEATSGLNASAGLTRSWTVMIGRAAGGQVHDRLRRLLDTRQEAREGLRALVGPARLLVARVQMDDRRSRLGRADRRFGDFVGVTGR